MITATERADAAGKDFNIPDPEPISADNWINLVFKEADSEPRMKGTGRIPMRFVDIFDSDGNSVASQSHA